MDHEITKYDDIQQARDCFQKLQAIAKETELNSQNLWNQTLADFSHILEDLYMSYEELKLKNEKLQETRQSLERECRRFQALFEYAADGYLFTDMQGVIQEVNKLAERLFNRECTDLIGRSLLDLMIEVDPVQFHRQIQILKNSKCLTHWELTIQPENQPSIPVSISVSAISDMQGQWIGLHWLVKDISDLKQVEIALAASEATLQSLLRNSPSHILKLDRAGQIHHLKQFTTDTDEDVIRDHFQQLIAEASQDIKHVALEQVFPSQTPITMEISGKGNKINENIYEVLIAPVFSQGRVEAALVVATDITERKRAKNELTKAKVAAKAANKAKSQFLDTMSHELRTPLNGVLGYSQLLLRDRDLSSQQTEKIEAIVRCGNHLLAMINEVLTLSKTEAGAISFEPEDINLFYFFEDLQNLFSFKAASKNLELQFHIGEDVPQYITTDAKKVKRILINLLENAIKFTEQGRVDCFVRWHSNRVNAQFHQLYCSVQDTGPGIPAHLIDTIFIPFEQNPLTRVTYGGIGLGLSICQEFVKFLGGAINLQSVEAQGTKAQFYIPVSAAQQAFEMGAALLERHF